MKRHHVELASAGGRLWARCRCGWAGDHYTGEGAVQAAERQARHHEQAVKQARNSRAGDRQRKER
ncbi:MAG: hypothetical protein ACRDYA_19155 [Egibacteraceae bacterium]